MWFLGDRSSCSCSVFFVLPKSDNSQKAGYKYHENCHISLLNSLRSFCHMVQVSLSYFWYISFSYIHLRPSYSINRSCVFSLFILIQYVGIVTDISILMCGHIRTSAQPNFHFFSFIFKTKKNRWQKKVDVIHTSLITFQDHLHWIRLSVFRFFFCSRRSERDMKAYDYTFEPYRFYELNIYFNWSSS